MKHYPFLILAILALLGACRVSDNCSPTSTRCAGNVAEICDADRNWQPQLDCDQVSLQSGAPFTCQFVSEQTEDGLVEGHTCMPANLGAAGGAS